jgi:hypothetical protein
MQTSNAQTANGFTTMKITIQEITNGFAYGTDNFNRPIRVSASLLASKGPAPSPGETWLISKSLTGVWTLSHILNNPPPPVITGALDDGTALRCLLSYLDQIGYIIDQTTPTSRAASDSAPAQDSISGT